MNNTFFRVSVWVGCRFVPLPLGDHVGPFLTEVFGKDGVEFLVNS